MWLNFHTSFDLLLYLENDVILITSDGLLYLIKEVSEESILSLFDRQPQIKIMSQCLENNLKDVSFDQVKYFETAKTCQHSEILVDINFNLIKIFLLFWCHLLYFLLLLTLSLLHSHLNLIEVLHVFGNLLDEIKHFVNVLIWYIFFNIKIDTIHEVDDCWF